MANLADTILNNMAKLAAWTNFDNAKYTSGAVLSDSVKTMIEDEVESIPGGTVVQDENTVKLSDLTEVSMRYGDNIVYLLSSASEKFSEEGEDEINLNEEFVGA